MEAQQEAFWPVLRWYVLRMTDRSDGAWGLVALATVLACVLSRRKRGRPPDLVVPTLLILLYAATYHVLPPLLRATIAATCIGCTLSPIAAGRMFDPGISGLLLLSLPVMSSLQFYLGYPLRVAVSIAAVPLLRLSGFAVIREGAALSWEGRLVCIDAPCSGVKMLWAGLYLAFTLIAFRRMAMKDTAKAAAFAFAAIMIGNVVRATALFCVEAGLLRTPDWVHVGIGIVVFSFVCLTVTWFTSKLRPCESYLST